MPTILTLSKKWQKKLLEMPESGMGYQVVDIYLKDGRVFVAVVMNCEFITEVKRADGVPFKVSDIKDIRLSRERF